eukprot:1159784-Pelagomonas_calceolata.AAC.11
MAWLIPCMCAVYCAFPLQNCKKVAARMHGHSPTSDTSDGEAVGGLRSERYIVASAVFLRTCVCLHGVQSDHEKACRQIIWVQCQTNKTSNLMTYSLMSEGGPCTKCPDAECTNRVLSCQPNFVPNYCHLQQHMQKEITTLGCKTMHNTCRFNTCSEKPPGCLEARTTQPLHSLSSAARISLKGV